MKTDRLVAHPELKRKWFKKTRSHHGPAGSSQPSWVEWKNDWSLIAVVL